MSLPRVPFSPDELMADVYFRADFIRLHARHGADLLQQEDFAMGAARLPVPGTDFFDLETAWGYGGPVAASRAALQEGLAAWKAQCRAADRVAELVRLHPFTDPAPLFAAFDMLAFNRHTVLVDLAQGTTSRWSGYSSSTKNCIRKAARALDVRRMGWGDAALACRLYSAGLDRNAAAGTYYFGQDYFASLMQQDWCTGWVAADAGEPVAASFFLQAGLPLAHYHLSGGTDRARTTHAHYLLLETAFEHFAALGCTLMHLGGGRTAAPDDALLGFKTKFSPLRADYRIGGMIHNQGLYRELGGGQGRFLCAGRGSS